VAVSGAATAGGSASAGDIVVGSVTSNVPASISLSNAEVLIDPVSFSAQDREMVFTTADVSWIGIQEVNPENGQVVSVPWSDPPIGAMLPERKVYVTPGPVWSVANRRLRAALRDGREALLDAAGVPSIVPALDGSSTLVVDGRAVIDAIDVAASGL